MGTRRSVRPSVGDMLLEQGAELLLLGFGHGALRDGDHYLGLLIKDKDAAGFGPAGEKCPRQFGVDQSAVEVESVGGDFNGPRPNEGGRTKHLLRREVRTDKDEGQEKNSNKPERLETLKSEGITRHEGQE